MGGLHFLLNSGKNKKFPYYLRNYVRYLYPPMLCRRALNSLLDEISRRDDADYILHRVEYYNHMPQQAKLSDAPRTIGDFTLKGDSRRKCSSVYFFDMYEYLRFFSPSYKWEYCPGDVTHIPLVPSIVKSRPISDCNHNSVVMKLNKLRHFIFINDRIPYEYKSDKVLFRGKVPGKPTREAFLQQFFGHRLCDLGDISRHGNPAWKCKKITIWQQLKYKFILALEGNDVSSNLKWIMSSNSVAVMPPPSMETWFMEGTLIPDYHYIAIKPDFSDFEERILYYIDHPDEVKQIIENAHNYVDQFYDTHRENLISLLVLHKYFVNTNQT